jgi:hypothetical protein
MPPDLVNHGHGVIAIVGKYPGSNAAVLVIARTTC